MIILLHVTIALSSLGLTTFTLFRPSVRLIQIGYGLVGLTIASGTYLVWLNPSHLIQACASGLIYLGLATVGIAVARQRLLGTLPS